MCVALFGQHEFVTRCGNDGDGPRMKTHNAVVVSTTAYHNAKKKIKRNENQQQHQTQEVQDEVLAKTTQKTKKPKTKKEPSNNCDEPKLPANTIGHVKEPKKLRSKNQHHLRSIAYAFDQSLTRESDEVLQG